MCDPNRPPNREATEARELDPFVVILSVAFTIAVSVLVILVRWQCQAFVN